VFVLPLIGHPLGHLAAILAGTIVSAALVIALKAVPRRRGHDVTSPEPTTAV
jgi:PTS system fructose-specific IIC component